jgi:hypothetical protein
MRDLNRMNHVLEQLHAQERQLSARRRRLHERLAIFPSDFGDRQERELSKRRRELHVQIDALEAERRAALAEAEAPSIGAAEPGDAVA